MPKDAAPDLDDFLDFARQKKEGFLSIKPKSGKAPVTVQFDRKALPGEGLKLNFAFQDGVIYLAGEDVTRAHARGLQQTLKDAGMFGVRVALAGDSVDVEGSEFDEVDDEWKRMKKILDRHPLTIPMQKRYDRVEKLLKESPPDIEAIRKALAVLDPAVARLRTSRGGHGRTSEESDIRINDRGRIAKIRNAWRRLEPKVRTTPMTRKVREDFLLMEKLVDSPDPDEKALTATFERLADFVALAKGKAVKARSDGDATAKLVRKLLAAWQQEIQPDLPRIIAGWVKSQGEGATEARKLLALAQKLPTFLQGETPDLGKAKKTIAFFLKAKAAVQAAPPRAAE